MPCFSQASRKKVGAAAARGAQHGITVMIRMTGSCSSSGAASNPTNTSCMLVSCHCPAAAAEGRRATRHGIGLCDENSRNMCFYLQTANWIPAPRCNQHRSSHHTCEACSRHQNNGLQAQHGLRLSSRMMGLQPLSQDQEHVAAIKLVHWHGLSTEACSTNVPGMIAQIFQLAATHGLPTEAFSPPRSKSRRTPPRRSNIADSHVAANDPEAGPVPTTAPRGLQQLRPQPRQVRMCWIACLQPQLQPCSPSPCALKDNTSPSQSEKVCPLLVC
jgi:hypothetical protein